MDPLFPFQQKLVDAMADSEKLFVAADMGLGKSRCAIEASERRNAARILICAPSIGLVSWPAEIEKWSSGHHTLTVTDPDLLPDAHILNDPVYAVVPYSEIARRPAAWVKAAARFDADVNVLDEAHYLAHATAARTQAIYGFRSDLITSMVRKDQVTWPMSGTPAPNFTSELWTHLHALAPDTILHPQTGRPMSEHQFRERFSTVRVSSHGTHVTGSVRTPMLRQMTASFFHRIRKSEVRSDMPPILWTTEPLPVNAAAARQHLEFPNGLDDAGLLNWLRTAYPSGSSERKATGLAKVAGAVEWAENFLVNGDRKLILFAWHTEVVEALHTALGPAFGSVCITGDTSIKMRAAATSAFQNDPRCRVFCGQMLAAGTSITLTAASDVAFVEDDWTPGTMEQAAARADRLGQTRGVVARILYTAGTKDQRIAQARCAKAREFNLMFN